MDLRVVYIARGVEMSSDHPKKREGIIPEVHVANYDGQFAQKRISRGGRAYRCSAVNTVIVFGQSINGR